jgi:protein TonB
MEAYILSADSETMLPRVATGQATQSSVEPPHAEHHHQTPRAKARTASRAAPPHESSLTESEAVRSEAIDVPGETREFQRTLYEHIERYQRYPERARQAQLTGVVQVSFIMDRGGSVLSAWIEERSGFSVLDQEALATIWRAQPLPPIPPHLPDRMQIVLPILFHVS